MTHNSRHVEGQFLQEHTFCCRIKLRSFVLCCQQMYILVCESDTLHKPILFCYLAMLNRTCWLKQVAHHQRHFNSRQRWVPRISGMYQPPRQFNMPRIRGARMRFYLRNSRVLRPSPPPAPSILNPPSQLHECVAGCGLLLLLPTGP